MNSNWDRAMNEAYEEQVREGGRFVNLTLNVLSDRAKELYGFHLAARNQAWHELFVQGGADGIAIQREQDVFDERTQEIYEEMRDA